MVYFTGILRLKKLQDFKQGFETGDSEDLHNVRVQSGNDYFAAHRHRCFAQGEEVAQAT